LAAIDRNVSFVRTRTFSEQIGRNFDQEHLVVWLTAVYGLLALLLASIGLYGVASYSAARRTKEIGIRMALGADRPNVLALIMRGAMRPIALGLAIGIPAALAVSRLIAGRLYGVKSYDPWIFASASLALVMSAMTAAYFPARRAASIEPMRALARE
jgi:ABC-type antimicrobial peptide transport system permease subunit